MQVKALTARFEAAHNSASPSHTSSSSPPKPRVRELCDRLEAAVRKQLTDNDNPPTTKPLSKPTPTTNSPRTLDAIPFVPPTPALPVPTTHIPHRFRERLNRVASLGPSAASEPPVDNIQPASVPSPRPIPAFDPIPDVGDGDLDDIEDLEHVDDEQAVSVASSQNENEQASDAEQRRRSTIETLGDEELPMPPKPTAPLKTSTPDGSAVSAEAPSSPSPPAKDPLAIDYDSQESFRAITNLDESDAASFTSVSDHLEPGPATLPAHVEPLSPSTPSASRRRRQFSTASTPSFAIGPSAHGTNRPHSATASVSSLRHRPASTGSAVATRDRPQSPSAAMSSASARLAAANGGVDRPDSTSKLAVRRMDSGTARRMDSDFGRPSMGCGPGSQNRLPKAKVVIARKRGTGHGHSASADGGTIDQAAMSADEGRGAVSMDERGVRRLVREYSNRRELLAGQVSMVNVLSEDGFGKVRGKDDGRGTGSGIVVPRKGERREGYQNRYDEFLDAEELAVRRDIKRMAEEDAALEKGRFGGAGGSSKQKYRKKNRLFGGLGGVGKAEKERQRAERHARHDVAVQRRSTILSGALDRVSMAADPWIDFITDNNNLPVAGKNRRPWNVMKRLFKRKPTELIKE